MKNWDKRALIVTAAFAVGGAALRFDFVNLGVLLFAGGAILALAIYLGKHELPAEPPYREEGTVTRDKRVDEALEGLSASRFGILVIVGNSGVGKSVLSRQIQERLIEESGKKVVPESNYGQKALTELGLKLKRAKEGVGTIFVLDQLEKVFQASRPAALQAIDFLNELLPWCAESQASCQCILVVRREWYVNLQIFPSLRPILEDSMLLGGFDPEEEMEALAAFRAQLIENLGGSARLADAVIEDVKSLPRADLYYTLKIGDGGEIDAGPLDHQVVPVEASAVVDALRYRKQHTEKELTVEAYQREGGLRDAMQEFFQAFVDSSGLPAVATRVLTALSVDPRARRALRVQDLAWITNVPRAAVEKVVQFLDSARLLRKVESYKFDWVHDFFAERFNEVSGALRLSGSRFLDGALLDPVERDHMVHFWEKWELEAEPDSEPRRFTTIRENSRRERNWSLGLFWFTVVLLWTRLLMFPIVSRLDTFLPGAPTGGIFSMGPLHPVGFLPTRLVDLSFLPVAISLTAWSWYTTTLFRRVFSRLADGRKRKVKKKEAGEAAGSERDRWAPSRWSWTVTVLSSVLVLLSCLFPRLWISFMGIGGLAVGLRYFFIGRGMRESWKETGGFFGLAGVGTSLNTLICLAVGLAYAVLLTSYDADTEGAIRFLVSVGTLMIMMYFAIWVTGAHCGKNRVYVILGAFRRYWRRPQKLA